MKVILVSILLLLSALVFLRKAPPPAIIDSPASVLAISETIHPSLAGLIDENGRPLPPDHFLGQWSLVFFGYTRCPDVCPVTLGFLTRLADSLPPGFFKFYFVSLDPGDSAATMRDYTASFHKDILGITGDAINQKKAADSFQTDFQTNAGQLAHPTQLFVVDPEGQLRYLVKTINAPQELLHFFSQLKGSAYASH